MNPTTLPADPAAPHGWAFFRCGGVNQVHLRDGADLAALERLDQKLWMALAMPVRGVAMDPATLALLDTDGDGSIRPPEILAAVRWTLGALRDAELLFRPGDSVPLAVIRDPDLLAAARRILESLGKADADAIGLPQVIDRSRIFANTRFNGDGVVPADAAGDEGLRSVILDILRVLPAVPDRSGKPGVDEPAVTRFFGEAAAFCDWADRPARDPAIAPLGPEATEAAAAAIRAVREKADDFFARCRLAAFDPNAAGSLNRQPADYLELGRRLLNPGSEEIAALPLAVIEPGKPMPLAGPLNPAWTDAAAALADRAVAPLLGETRTELPETDWWKLQAAIAPFEAWRTARPDTPVAVLGRDRLRELLAGDARDRLLALIEQDREPRREYERIAGVEKLVRFRRDLHEVLTNTVNFADFYGGTRAMFQAGTLYLDARACSLCVEVVDPAKHAALAGLSGAFLAYCDLARPEGLKRTIVAAFTDGDSDNLMVGRNGVFYDRDGRDWSATITKIVSNPISVREAFWLPYKKLIRLIEEQVAKRAQAADAASTAKLASAAESVATADQRPPPREPPKKIDLGTIALIGTAIGGISALVGGFLQALFGLGFWLPLGVAGVLLLISGPSMLLASMKLRQRNLGPLLDASGWAINTKARINIPFGASLTGVAALPPGANRNLRDPFAERRRGRPLLLLILALLLAAAAWRTGGLDRILPEWARRNPSELHSVEPDSGADNPGP